MCRCKSMGKFVIIMSMGNVVSMSVDIYLYMCRAWNSSRKRGFLQKWKSKIVEKYFSVEKNWQAYFFLWKWRWWICECKLKVQNWYSSWISVCYISSNLPPECLKLPRLSKFSRGGGRVYVFMCWHVYVYEYDCFIYVHICP